jgi:homoserine kinase
VSEAPDSPAGACREVRVRVPASSGNLGPGFDVLAAALGLHLTVEVAWTGRFAVVTDLDVDRTRENLVVRAFELLHPADGFEFRVSSEIPLSGGLGSSAAASVGGLLAANELFGAGADVFALATAMEGHPDNVGASLHGGIVICDGDAVHRFDPPAELEGVVAVPAAPVRTAQARKLLPEQVPLLDAVANLSAIAELTLGLAQGDFGLIAAGLRDRLHEPYRARLYPRSAALLAQARAFGALGATISGAGPTVLFWSRRDDAAAVVAALQAHVHDWAQVSRVPFEPEGAQVIRV